MNDCMSRFMLKDKKAAGLVTKKLIILILVALVVVVVLFFIFKPQMWDWVRQLPGYNYSDRDEVIEVEELDESMANEDYFVATINDSYIYFCIDDKCKNLFKSKLLIKRDSNNGKIYVDQINNDRIGIIKDDNVKLYSDFLGGKGIYSEVRDDVPPYRYILNLNGSTWSLGYFYRASELENPHINVKEKYKKEGYYTIGELNKSYNGVREFIKNKNYESDWIKLKYSMRNRNNFFGFDTGEDTITHFKLRKVNDNYYIKMRDSDLAIPMFNSKDTSDWVLLEYFNQYRSFAWVPNQYKLNDK